MRQNRGAQLCHRNTGNVKDGRGLSHCAELLARLSRHRSEKHGILAHDGEVEIGNLWDTDG